MEHFLQHPWYYFKEYQFMQLISGLLSVALTVYAMTWVDNQAKNRWLKEGYLKRKIELEIEIRKVLLEIKQEIIQRNIPYETTQGNFGCYYNELIRSFSPFWDKYKMDILIDEFNIITSSSQNPLEDLKQKYEVFNKDKTFDPTKAYQDCLNQIYIAIAFLQKEMNQ
ncbi:MAG: hypothetical protein PHE78_06445 [Candidatus Gastranaerophilales bacterium]|nr:hypothetical protein [Candidatus Gastranaerophilales bacterium]